MSFDYQMVTFEEIIKNDFFKWVRDSSFASFVPHALKGQKLLAQGIALGIMAISNAPCKGKSFKYCL